MRKTAARGRPKGHQTPGGNKYKGGGGWNLQEIKNKTTLNVMFKNLEDYIVLVA